ncbi:MAG: DUF202 domain-containing protein [Tissierellia bacterium]|nr:DUF202 domain-containing protein [Tissierellia bacterium]
MDNTIKDHGKYDDPKKLTTSEILAIERTILSNERTALSYIRTFMAILGSGIGLLKFFMESKVLYSIGWIAIFSSFLALYQGIRRYWAVRKTTKKFEEYIRPKRKKS